MKFGGTVYNQYNTPGLVARFWEKVFRGEPDECWPWLGGRDDLGYGTFRIGRVRKTHRIAWELTRGPIPVGLCVLHRCDNPPCVNPNHLWLGTFADNAHDRDAKGHLRIPHLSGPACGAYRHGRCVKEYRRRKARVA